MKSIYLILGRAGAGKTSITKQIAIDLNLKVLKSYTTRERRKEEINNPDVDHEFVTEEEAAALLKEGVIAYTEINNIKYFATLNQLKNSDLYVIDPNGLKMLCENLNKINVQDIDLIPIYISVPYNIRKERCIQRSDIKEDIFEQRNKSENTQFEEFETITLEHYKNIGAKYYIHDNTTDFTKSVENIKEFINKVIK